MMRVMMIWRNFCCRGLIWTLGVAISAIAFLSSCDFRTLEDPSGVSKVQIHVNANAVANVNVGVYNEHIPLPDVHPEVMHFMFFNHDTDKVLTESYISYRDSLDNGILLFTDHIDIYPGLYKFMIYNFDAQYTLIRDYDDWAEAEAYCRTVSDYITESFYDNKAKAKAQATEKANKEGNVPENEGIGQDDGSKAAEDSLVMVGEVVYDPDHLFLGVEEDEEIPLHDTLHVIVAEALTIIDTYYLQVKIDGLQYVKSARAFLTGMASGNHLSTRTPLYDQEITMYFELIPSKDSRDGDAPVLCNVFNTFGRDESRRQMLIFDIVSVDGMITQLAYDISGLFLTPEAKEHHWLLLEDHIVITAPDKPATGDGGGGMDPSVGDWDEENHEIIL